LSKCYVFNLNIFYARVADAQNILTFPPVVAVHECPDIFNK